MDCVVFHNSCLNVYCPKEMVSLIILLINTYKLQQLCFRIAYRSTYLEFVSDAGNFTLHLNYLVAESLSLRSWLRVVGPFITCMSMLFMRRHDAGGGDIAAGGGGGGGHMRQAGLIWYPLPIDRVYISSSMRSAIEPSSQIGEYSCLLAWRGSKNFKLCGWEQKPLN